MHLGPKIAQDANMNAKNSLNHPSTLTSFLFHHPILERASTVLLLLLLLCQAQATPPEI